MNTTCQTCGTPLPPKTWKGRDRKFCSERCRKAQYDKACVECGARIDGTTPSKCTGLCADCARPAALARAIATNRAKEEPRRQRLVARWNEGATVVELAAEFGVARGTIGAWMNYLRCQGYDLPYRYRTYAGEPLIDGQPVRKVAA